MKKYLIGLLLVAVAFGNTSCFKHVAPRHVGIKVKTMGDNKGVQPVTLDVGRYWIGVYWDLYTYPTNQIIYPFTLNSTEGSPNDESIKFQDKDGLACNVDIAVFAHVDPALVTTVFQSYGGDMESIIVNYVRQDVLNGFIAYSSKLPAEKLYSENKMEMLEYVKQTVKAKYLPTGVVLDDISYKSDIRLPQELMTAINDKIKATQLALKTEAEVQQSEAEAKKLVAQAQGQYEAKLLEAKGNIALGKSLNENLIRYRAFEKWNGVSPVYSGSGSPLPLILK